MVGCVYDNDVFLADVTVNDVIRVKPDEGIEDGRKNSITPETLLLLERGWPTGVVACSR